MQSIIIVSTGILAALAAYVLAVNVGTHNDVGVLLLAISLGLTTAAMCHSILQRGGAVLLIVSTYLTAFFLFPGILHASRNAYPFFGMTYNPNDVTNAAIVVLLFVAFFIIGVVSANRRREAPTNQPQTQPRLMKRSFNWALILLSLAMIAVIGPSQFLARRADGIELALQQEAGLMVMAFARALPVIAVAATLHRILITRRSVANLTQLFFAGAALFVANYPVAVPRFVLFGVMLTLAPLILDFTSRMFKTLFAVAALIGLGTIFPLMSHLQRGAEDSVFTFDILEYYMNSPDLDGFQSTINATMLVSDTGLRWGWQVLSAAFFFVPRSIWPSKGERTGAIAAEHAGYDYFNISSPLPSEIYVDFGYLGCIFGGFLIGYAAQRLDRTYVSSKNRHSLRKYLMFGGIFGYTIIVFRGPLLGIAGPVALYFVLAYIASASMFLDRFPRRRAGVRSMTPAKVLRRRVTFSPIP